MAHQVLELDWIEQSSPHQRQYRSFTGVLYWKNTTACLSTNYMQGATKLLKLLKHVLTNGDF